MLTLGSLFDGIGGWLLAAVHNGVKPIWSSEIEKFPMAVTKHHFPDVIQLGDITKLDGATLPPVDIICAGSPCQDLSVAGKREGLKGERSGLFINAINIVRRMRDATGGKFPRFFVWENVPGAFSSGRDEFGNKCRGADFRAVLEEIGQTEIPMPADGRWAENGVAQLPGCEIAWRVLDAVAWVPQRRKRIFLVADFAASGRCAEKILFVEPSVCGNLEKGESERKEVAGSTADSVGDAGKPTAYGLVTKGNGDAFLNDKTHTALNCGGGQDGQGYPCVMVRDRAEAHGNNPIIFEPGVASRDGGHIYTDGIAPTLRAEPGGRIENIHKAVYSMGHVERETQFLENQANPLTACDYKQPPMVGPVPAGEDMTPNTAGTLVAGYAKCYNDNPFERGYAVRQQYAVRRLMPIECERLQGLPDNYTLIDDKSCSDSARYKALGNGMAQPCADFVIRRIKEVCLET